MRQKVRFSDKIFTVFALQFVLDSQKRFFINNIFQKTYKTAYLFVFQL